MVTTPENGGPKHAERVSMSPAPSPAPLNDAEAQALEKYQAAMKLYICAVTELSNCSETLRHKDFEHLCAVVDYALEIYQESRWELEFAREGSSYRVLEELTPLGIFSTP